MDAFTGIPALVGGAITGLLAILLSWTKWRERHWMLLSRRRKALRRLLQDSKWRDAGVLDYHFAMIDAFGSSVEPRELLHIESRQDPVRLLADRIQAGAWATFDGEAKGYVDGRGPSRLPAFLMGFPAVSTITMLAASVSGGLAAMGGLYGWLYGQWWLGALACFYGLPTLAIMVMFLAWASKRKTMAANRPCTSSVAPIRMGSRRAASNRPCSLNGASLSSSNRPPTSAQGVVAVMPVNR